MESEIAKFYAMIIKVLYIIGSILTVGILKIIHNLFNQNKNLKNQIIFLQEEQKKQHTEKTISDELESFRLEMKDMFNQMVTQVEFKNFKESINFQLNTALSEYRNSKIEFRVTCQQLKDLMLKVVPNGKRETIIDFFEQMEILTRKRFEALEPDDIVDALPKKDKI